ncbi:MAG: response regulator [Candidatus Marinimicrobia bacterium]|nr:response regulator [Candidatus Neomarinimicrobiota bacterium]
MNLNILIVDDSSTVRSVLKKTLDLAQIPAGEIFEAENGRDALQILDDNWIDLVFADINMPIMGGIEMVEKMEENGLMKTIPVIVVTTEGSQTRIQQLKKIGIKGYIRKPFTPESVRNEVLRIMGGPDGKL